MDPRYLLDTNILYLHSAEKAECGSASIPEASPWRSRAFGNYLWRVALRGSEKRTTT